MWNNDSSRLIIKMRLINIFRNDTFFFLLYIVGIRSQIKAILNNTIPHLLLQWSF